MTINGVYEFFTSIFLFFLQKYKIDIWFSPNCSNKNLFFFFKLLVFSIGWIMEKEMVTHSSTLGWKIPWIEEAGRLQSMGLQRVRHNWATSLSFYRSFWRRKWQPTHVFLPGESHGQRGLVGYSQWGCKELDTTKQLTHTYIGCIGHICKNCLSESTPPGV